MAVGASKPTVVAAADGFFSVKNKMLVSPISKSNYFVCKFSGLRHCGYRRRKKVDGCKLIIFFNDVGQEISNLL